MLILLLHAGRMVCSRQVKNSKWSKLADTRFNHSNHYSFKRQSCTFASSFLNLPAQVETYGDYSKCPKCEKNIKSTFIIRHIKVRHIWNMHLLNHYFWSKCSFCSCTIYPPMRWSVHTKVALPLSRGMWSIFHNWGLFIQLNFFLTYINIQSNVVNF